MVASIEHIERLIATLDEAAAANLSTPAREGNVVRLSPDDGDEIMITGDLHGNRRNFHLICRIAALGENPRRHLVLQEVCHGGPTYPSGGGCMSHGLLEEVAKLKVAYPAQVHFLLGNHELSELTDYPIQKNRQMLNVLFHMGMQQLYGPAAERVRQAYMPFIRTSPLAVHLAAGVFISHSLPERVDLRKFDTTVFSRPLEPDDYQEHGALFRLVWGRDYREENAAAFARLVDATLLVHGHEPSPDGYSTPSSRQIILDGSNDKACYLMLPIDRLLDHQQAVAEIRRLAAVRP